MVLKRGAKQKEMFRLKANNDEMKALGSDELVALIKRGAAQKLDARTPFIVVRRTLRVSREFV